MMNGGKTKGLDGKIKLSQNIRYCTIFVVFRIDFAVLILVPLNISRSPWEKWSATQTHAKKFVKASGKR